MMRMYMLLALIFNSSVFAAENLTPNQEVLHFLNRLSFGARPTEIQTYFKSANKFKIDWLNEQMNPEKIDDSVLDLKLHQIKSLDMEPKDNFTFYKKPEDLARELNLPMDEMDSKKDIRKEVKEAIGDSRFPDMLINELQAQKLIRAIESKKQLQEILVDFWFNYFNVDVGKNEIKYFGYDYENNVIRKNVFKNFKEMLVASAHHPAMIVYLDNFLSRAKAINENYAREIMELHTLGVDGGYTQKDVQELARILTGWSANDLKNNPKWIFKPNIHDKEEKKWLNNTFPAGGGEEEGDRALDILANHPKTAQHVCKKLAIHFFSESPPASILKKCESVFINSHGDFKKIYSTLFLSDEFSNNQIVKAKIKKPFHLMASSVRALGGEVVKANDLIKTIRNMGEELYRCAPPTGYTDLASSWVNPGSMVSRLQFSLDLTSQKINGVLIGVIPINKNKELKDQIKLAAMSIGLSNMSLNSQKIIIRELESEPMYFAANEIKPSFMAKLTGLILGSPEFQRR